MAIDVSASAINTFDLDGAKLSIKPNEKRITILKRIDIQDSDLEYFNDKDKSLPRREDIESITDEMNQTVKKVLAYLKYFYGIYQFDENLRSQRTFEWSTDNQHWLPFPDKRPTAWRGTNPVYTLPDPLLGWISELDQQKIQPFFAFTHLHKAFEEQDTRHQWINATIAAELAFKEFLSRFDARTITLMEYVPSPPIDRLYKNVLVDYTGQESPKYRELKKGAEIRNTLIHRPATPSPDKKTTLIYLRNVEIAIMHLYTLLYKDHPFISYIFELSKGRLEQLLKT